MKPIIGLVTMSLLLLSPFSYGLDKKSACLYYAVNKELHKFCFTDMRSGLVLKIPDAISPGKMSEIKVGGGNLLWHTADKLFTWDGTKIHTIELDEFQTIFGGVYGDEFSPLIDKCRCVDDFLISPTGNRIIWNVNLIPKVINSGRTALVEHRVYASGVDGKNKRLILKENFSVDGYSADAGLERHLVYWPKGKYKPNILISTLHTGQLTSEYEGLYALNLKDGSISEIIKDFGVFLSFDENNKVALTPNDDTCCAGTDYSNNSVYVMNLANGQSVTVYDEWEEFKKPFVIDEEDRNEYIPANAVFSPSGEWIAISISGGRVLATVRAIGEQGRITFNDRQVIGWVDETRLLLGKVQGRERRHEEDLAYAELVIYNLTTGQEHALPLKNVIPVALE